MIEIPNILAIMAFGVFGSLVRVLVGYYKNYELGFRTRHAALTLIVGALAGALVAVLVNTEDFRIAIIAGLGSTDLLEAFWRGLAKKVSGGAYSSANSSGGILPTYLSANQINAVQYAKKTGRITATAYAQMAGVTSRTAERHLKAMVKQGLLTKSGTKKGTVYKIAKKR